MLSLNRGLLYASALLISCANPIVDTEDSGDPQPEANRIEFMLDRLNFSEGTRGMGAAFPDATGSLFVGDDFRYTVTADIPTQEYHLNYSGIYETVGEEIVFRPDSGGIVQRSGLLGPDLTMIGVGPNGGAFTAYWETIRTPIPQEIRDALVGSWKLVRFGTFDATADVVITFEADGRYRDVRAGELAGEAATSETQTTYSFLNGKLVIHDGIMTFNGDPAAGSLVVRSKLTLQISGDTLVLPYDRHGFGLPGLTSAERAAEPLDKRDRVFARVK